MFGVRGVTQWSGCCFTKAREVTEKMLGQTLVTKQTGPAGKPVNVLYIANKMSLAREMYFALLLDRATAGAVMHVVDIIAWNCAQPRSYTYADGAQSKQRLACVTCVLS
jgi:succinyl-CoA synthetase beta subunit